MLLILGCLAAGIAGADIAGPDWATTDEGAVHVKWADWTSFNAGAVYGSDVYTAYDENGDANDPASAGTYGQADAYSYGNTFRIGGSGADGVQIEANWDFSIWVSTYSGFDLQQVYLQITYWDDEFDSDWRMGWDLGLTTVGTGSTLTGGAVFEGETHDTIEGLITEAYSFTISGVSADGFFVDFNSDPAMSVVNPGQIYSITADSVSYNAVPEPATAMSLLLGGASLYFLRKRNQERLLNQKS
jgi:hypothetical protein